MGKDKKEKTPKKDKEKAEMGVGDLQVRRRCMPVAEPGWRRRLGG
jgi:hypothetical protein